MDNVLKIEVKSVYGRTVAYPRNELAQKFADLMGRKTFDKMALVDIVNLGYVFEYVQAVL